MTTFNIETTLPTGKLHKRQTGLWGQLLASSEIEAKLARVEPLYKELHGRNLSRTAFFTMCREIARESKTDAMDFFNSYKGNILIRERCTEVLCKLTKTSKMLFNNCQAKFLGESDPQVLVTIFPIILRKGNRNDF